MEAVPTYDGLVAAYLTPDEMKANIDLLVAQVDAKNAEALITVIIGMAKPADVSTLLPKLLAVLPNEASEATLAKLIEKNLEPSELAANLAPILAKVNASNADTVIPAIVGKLTDVPANLAALIAAVPTVQDKDSRDQLRK